MFDVAVLDFRGELGGEVVGLDDHLIAHWSPSKGRYPNIAGIATSSPVTALVVSAPDTPGAMAARFAVPAAAIPGRIHHAPDRPQKAEERASAHSGRKDDHLRFELQPRFADRALHRGLDGPHLGRTDFFGAVEASAECLIHLGRAEHLEQAPAVPAS